MVQTNLFCRQHLAIFLVIFPYVDHRPAIKLIDRDTTLIRYLCSPVAVSLDAADLFLSLIPLSLLLKVLVNQPQYRSVESEDAPPRIAPSWH